MQVITTALPEVRIFEPRIFHDNRGYFFETFQVERYQKWGIPLNFVQDNFSYSVQNTVRGLHYQLKHPQGKLVFVAQGRIFDVVVDIRQNSSTFGKAIWVELDDIQHRQIYVPPGFAHGFCALSDHAAVVYKCTDYYYPADEYGVYWNDPDLGIPWLVHHPLISEKDAKCACLKDIVATQLPL